MKKKIIMLICLLLIFLTGCSYQELNELALISGIGIDYKDNNYVVTAEILDLKKEGDGSTKKSIFYEGVGKTIPSAIRNIMTKYPKIVYLGHLELIIVGEDAIDKTNEIFDFFFSSPEASTEVVLTFANDEEASNFFNVTEEFENNSPTENLVSMIKNTEKRNGTIFESMFEEFYSNYFEEGIDPLAITVKLKDDDEVKANTTVITNMAPVKDNKIAPVLSDDEALGYTIINNTFEDVMINSLYEDTIMTVIVYNPKSKMDVAIEDGKVLVDIEIKADGHISVFDKVEDISTSEVREKIQNSIDEKINELVNAIISYGKDNNMDILGIKNNIYKHFNNQYDEYKDVNIYDVAEFNIKTNVNVFRSGITYKGSDTR